MKWRWHNSCCDCRNLGNNMFPVLPTAGLERLLHLKTFNNPRLREFPPPESFPRVQSLVLSYAYHCCVFLPLVPAEPPRPPLRESVLFPTDNEFDMSLWNSSLTDIWPQLREYTSPSTLCYKTTLYFFICFYIVVFMFV